MKKSHLLVATLMALVVAVTVGVWLNAEYLISTDAETARREGYEVRPYVDAVRLQRKAERKESASESDLSNLRELVSNPNEFIRARGVSAVCHFGKRSHRVLCVELLQSRLKDPSEMVRAAALRGIWRIDRSLGQTAAVQMTPVGENDRSVKESILEGLVHK
jgi:hypothetical protein